MVVPVRFLARSCFDRPPLFFNVQPGFTWQRIGVTGALVLMIHTKWLLPQHTRIYREPKIRQKKGAFGQLAYFFGTPRICMGVKSRKWLLYAGMGKLNCVSEFGIRLLS